MAALFLYSSIHVEGVTQHLEFSRKLKHNGPFFMNIAATNTFNPFTHKITPSHFQSKQKFIQHNRQKQEVAKSSNQIIQAQASSCENKPLCHAHWNACRG